MNYSNIRQYAYFSELPAGALFSKNGNQYKKRSTRTAEMVKPVEYSGLWFYFARREPCQVNLHDRLANNYFEGRKK